MVPNRSRRRTPDATGNPPLIDQLGGQINRDITAPRITIQADRVDYDALPSGTTLIASVARKQPRPSPPRAPDRSIAMGLQGSLRQALTRARRHTRSLSKRTPVFYARIHKFLSPKRGGLTCSCGTHAAFASARAVVRRGTGPFCSDSGLSERRGARLAGAVQLREGRGKGRVCRNVPNARSLLPPVRIGQVARSDGHQFKSLMLPGSPRERRWFPGSGYTRNAGLLVVDILSPEPRILHEQ
jgi:hypothetical protein